MTDTSRPTVEALIARLRYQAGAHMGQFRSEMNGAADVLGALLTERDDQREVKNMWIERAAHFAKERDAARAQIAELEARLADRG